MSRLSLNTKFRLAIIVVALIIMLFLMFSFRAFTVVSEDYPKKYSLYVSLYDPSNVKQLKQDIWKYSYENGVKTFEEKLLSVVGKKDGPMSDVVRTDIGENKIYNNRYLVTGIGNVIDLKNKTVLSEERNNIVKAGKDSVVFYINDAFKGKYYTVLKMKEGLFEKVRDPLFKSVTGQDIGIDYDLQNRRIWLYPPKGEKKLLVQDAGFGEDVLNAKGTVTIPVFWVDNWNFIFPYYPITKNKVTLILVNAKSGEQLRLGDISDLPKSSEASAFTRDPDNNILFISPKGNFIVDVKGKSVRTLEFYHCGNNFDVQCDNAANGRIIKHKGSEIGKLHFELNSVRDCRSAIALEKKMKVGNEVFSQGIGVWSVHNKKWSTLMVDNVAAVIDWVEE